PKMWLLILLIALLCLRWFILRGWFAMIALLPAADWIIPAALVLGHYAKVSSFWKLILASAIYYILSLILVLLSSPVAILTAVLFNLGRWLGASQKMQARTPFQNYFISAVQSAIVFAFVDYLALFLVEKLINGFQLHSLTWDMYAVLFLFATFNGMASAS